MPCDDTPVEVRPGPERPLFDVRATRAIEHLALGAVPPHTLMQRAGLATARLALALAPSARMVWVAAGPGNNGGDGLEAAMHLQRWGKQVVVTWLGSAASASSDTLASWQAAVDAGVRFDETPPAACDLCVDALLGIGATRTPQGRMAQWISHMHALRVPVLCVDVPTGLDADTGQAAPICARAIATLCLLTLKPGLFTADGRDAAGQVWLDTLGVDLEGDAFRPAARATARLAGAPAIHPRPHASHKGSYGDVAVIGGAPGMAGAALLAASAALHAGAGRVYVGLLDPSAAAQCTQPELMLRVPDTLDLERQTVVCGCGGGDAVRAHLPRVLSTAPRLVLDADALNAIAQDDALHPLLRARAARQRHTVLTPHPLEAARLLGTTRAEVQHNRLAAASELARRFQCTVVLKGSGSIVAAPGQLPIINPTGNARLASAGTGDVLAGAVGAALAAGLPAFQAACEAVYLHGLCADLWPADQALTASRLAQAVAPQNAPPFVIPATAGIQGLPGHKNTGFPLSRE